MMHLPYIHNRKNTIAQWSPSDSEKNYVPVQKNGTTNYSLSDVTYKYNSHGFRCDEFTEKSDFPILFMGCSLTEGIGLPESEMWARKLISDVRIALPQKQIPFFSLALAGAGFDTMAREFYNIGKTIKPKYVFYLSSSVYRREVWYNENKARVWMPTDVRNNFTSPLVRVLVDSYFAVNQTTKSLMLIDSIAQQFGTKVIVMQLHNSTEEKCAIEPISVDYSNFSNIVNVNLNIGTLDQFQHHAHLFPGRPILARDDFHPGACWQHEVFLHAKNIIQNQYPELTL